MAIRKLTPDEIENEAPSIAVPGLRRLTDEEVQAERDAKREKILQEREFVPVTGVVSAIMNASQAFQREEAGFASPILDMIRRRRGPVFGAPPPTERSTGEAIMAGLRGETFSRSSTQGDVKQNEIGDIYRELGVPDTEAAILGLATTEILPSSLAMTAMGGFITRFALKRAGREAIKGSGKIAKGVPKALNVVDDFRNVFRQINTKVKGGVRNVAEVMEALTNIDSREILYAIRNPEVLTKEFASPELVGDMAKDAADKSINAMKRNPDFFKIDDEVPLTIARSMSEQFNGLLDDAGQELAKQKTLLSKTLKVVDKATGVKRGIDPQILQESITRIMHEEQLLEASGKRKAIFKDNKLADALDDVRVSISDLTKKNKNKVTVVSPDGQMTIFAKGGRSPMEFQDLIDLKKSMRDIAFKHGNVDVAGIARPLPEVEATFRRLYGEINDLIDVMYKDFPEFLEANKKFSALADVRSDLSKTLKSPEKISRLLRTLDSKNPDQLVQLSELINTLPGGERYMKSIDTYLDMKNSSIVERFPFLKDRDPVAVEKGFMSLFDKKPGDFTIEESRTLEKLAGEIGFNLDDLIAHKVAKSFSAKTNFFRALAAGSIAAGLAFGPGAGLVSALGGFLLTDPRAQGAIIRNLGKKSAQKAIKGTGLIAGEAAKVSIRRQILEADKRQKEANRQSIF